MNKHEVYSIYNKALNNGKLVKNSFCEFCGLNTDKVDGHHYDYDKPLDVIWVCKNCHPKLHLYFKRGKPKERKDKFNNFILYVVDRIKTLRDVKNRTLRIKLTKYNFKEEKDMFGKAMGKDGKYKSIKINSDTHKKLEYVKYKTGICIVDFINQAIDHYLEHKIYLDNVPVNKEWEYLKEENKRGLK